MEEALMISWPDDVDDLKAREIIELSNGLFKAKGIQHESGGLFAAYEWIVPTSFVVMLSGLFFKSFMEEAGKDAYQMLKSRLKAYILERREIKTKLIAASLSTEKLSKTYDQSLSISLKARLHSRLLVIVLVSEKVDGQDAHDMIEGVFQVLNMIYQQCQEAVPEDKVNINIRPEERYLIANPETKLWEILTSEDLSKRYKNH